MTDRKPEGDESRRNCDPNIALKERDITLITWYSPSALYCRPREYPGAERDDQEVINLLRD